MCTAGRPIFPFRDANLSARNNIYVSSNRVMVFVRRSGRSTAVVLGIRTLRHAAVLSTLSNEDLPSASAAAPRATPALGGALGGVLAALVGARLRAAVRRW